MAIYHTCRNFEILPVVLKAFPPVGLCLLCIKSLDTMGVVTLVFWGFWFSYVVSYAAKFCNLANVLSRRSVSFLFLYLFIYLAAMGLSCVLQDLLLRCGYSCSTACGILVPWPGMEPASPALQGGFWATWEVLRSQFLEAPQISGWSLHPQHNFWKFCWLHYVSAVAPCLD